MRDVHSAAEAVQASLPLGGVEPWLIGASIHCLPHVGQSAHFDLPDPLARHPIMACRCRQPGRIVFWPSLAQDVRSRQFKVLNAADSAFLRPASSSRSTRLASWLSTSFLIFRSIKQMGNLPDLLVREVAIIDYVQFASQTTQPNEERLLRSRGAGFHH